MKNKYINLVDQTFEFPTEEFKVNDNGTIQFRGIDMNALVEKHGSPLQVTYLPRIGENIQRAKTWFKSAFQQHKYQGNYHYCYCTKSSHFKHVIAEALKNDVHIETSSAYDLEIVKRFLASGDLNKSHYVICNGLKTPGYIDRIVELIEMGMENLIVILDNTEEIHLLQSKTNAKLKVGIRIASEEEPKFEFWTSRLGIGYKFIDDFYRNELAQMDNVELVMLHFFINTGIRDTAYYWNELRKCLNVYVALSKSCETLSMLNIGGGFPIKRSLNFDFDYQYIIDELVSLVGRTCDTEQINHPDLFTEFGSFTVGESGMHIFSIIQQKKQNDRERWNMVDGSFMTSLPDTWAINERFILLPINKWHNEYERVLLGGLTCDSDDYYNSEQHVNAIYMPKHDDKEPLRIAFFHTGAYQDSISGYGGLKHCLIPSPKMVVIDKVDGKLVETVFSQQQTADSMMKTLGY